MKTNRFNPPWKWILLAGLFIVAVLLVAAAEPEDGKAKAKNQKAAAKNSNRPLPSPLGAQWTLGEAGANHRDFPALTLSATGERWVAYIEFDGKADVVKLEQVGGEAVKATVSQAGVAHQPAVACDAAGGVWIFWGQTDSRNVVTLRARHWAQGKLEPEITLAQSEGSDTFADAQTDQAGNVWVTWQSMRRGQGDILARYLDAKTASWSKEFKVSKEEGGNWEPRISFDGHDGAWIVFDSSRGGEFNLYLARLGLDGQVTEYPLTSSPEYEARASITPAKDGKGFWIAGERGRLQWGRNQRGHQDVTGMNGEKRILLGYYDLAAGSFNEVPVPQEGKPSPRTAGAVNLPIVATDAAGNPWLAWRYYFQTRWLIAVSKYDPAAKLWAEPMEVPKSGFGQDRHCTLTRDAKGAMLICWPSDRRENKVVLQAGVFMAELAPKFAMQKERVAKVTMLPEPEPYLNPPTPDRPRTEHHTWELGGRKYRLVYGDLHRHTDFSNCRTGFDGCVLEHFRYAYDMAALDFMGTSDHTDIVKKYDPYEWWQTQRMVDVFYAPGKFNSLYAYEREQSYPWGHRNIIFPERGGPIVYINRKLYEASQWSALYPVHAGAGEITPQELWTILHQYGKAVAVISHTGATGMGTDWDRYDKIDNTLENTVEIFQGARVSYEGLGAPQPTVGLRRGQKYTADNASEAEIPAPPSPINDFGKKRNNGVYQHALADGHKLGVFASSDHISQHTAFGGVYVEENTRMGLIEAFKARRTMAATDKIFVEFSCNGQPMGSILESPANPELKYAVNGTAPIKRLTIVRNEKDYRVFEPGKVEVDGTFKDEAPLAGENRYYLRVEQEDGNMAWSSPVWVLKKG